MAIGALIQPAASIKHPLATPNKIGPRKAMGQALAAYLASLTFRVDGGDDPQDREFQIVPEAIKDVWPPPDKPLLYPGVSIVETGDTKRDGVNFTPFALEETRGLFDELAGQCQVGDGLGATVLWKEDDAVVDFQVDFWTDLEPDRQAIEAGLDAAFSPGGERSGILVEGPGLYYSRPVRFTLLGAKNDDTAVTAYTSEWRLRCVVRAECDIVSLRMATTTTVTRPCVTVIDPNDPPEET